MKQFGKIIECYEIWYGGKLREHFSGTPKGEKRSIEELNTLILDEGIMDAVRKIRYVNE